MSDDGFEIRPLRGLDELQGCVDMQRLVWGEDCTEIVPVSVLLSIPRLGGVVAGAFAPDGGVAGIIVGFTGVSDGQPIHWSDMLAVRPELRDRRLGERLKRFQRKAVLPLGIEHVYWTFDPLESRNAYLNLTRLGAIAAEYHPDYYGPDTSSPLHAGLDTDRFVADWPIASERVQRRLGGMDRPLDTDEWQPLPAVLDAELSGAWPVPGEVRHEADSPRVRIAIPADIQALKQDDAGLARTWRRATRAAFEACLATGYSATDVVRAGAVSHYVLSSRSNAQARSTRARSVRRLPTAKRRP